MSSLNKQVGRNRAEVLYMFILLYTLDLQLMSSQVSCIVFTLVVWTVLPEKYTNGLKHLTLFLPQFEGLFRWW